MTTVIIFPRERSAARVEPKDRVKLNSGGPEMLVLSVDRREDDGVLCAECVWLGSGGEKWKRSYPLVCLTLCHRHADEWWPQPGEEHLR